MSKANILGVCVDIIRLADVLAMIRDTAAADRRALIAYIHVMGMRIACEQEWFRQFLNRADLLYCDGMGVKLGARWLGYDLPERFPLTEWIWQLAGLVEANEFTIFLLGNPPGMVEKAAARLRERFPRLRIVGMQHGFFEKSLGHPECEAVVAQVNAARPDILLVGFGMPAQEKWLQENWERLDVKVALTGGAVFEYVAGELKRGPRWMTQHYLEWLARLLISPRRYLKRYLFDNPVFLYRVLRQRITRGGQNGCNEPGKN